MHSRELHLDASDPILRLEELPSSRVKRRLQRGIHLLPCILTAANLMCGCYAIRVIVDGNPLNYNNASSAIWIAWLFDAFDGALARATGASTAFGKEFDSLADIVTFGIAPVFLAYVWGLRPLASAAPVDIGSSFEIGWIIGLFYIVCCAWRLARFNLQSVKPSENRFFLGLPTPAGGLLIAALVRYSAGPIRDAFSSWLLLSLLTVLALLMISSMRHYSFKDVEWMRRRPSMTVIIVTVLLAGVVHFLRFTLLAVAAAYVCHGIAIQLLRVASHRVARARWT